MFNNFKISHKLNLYISLLLIVAMSATAGLTYYVGKKELFEKLEEKLHVVNHLKMERVRSLFTEVDDLILSIHNDKEIKGNLKKLIIQYDIDSLIHERKRLIKEIVDNIVYRDEPSIIHNLKIISLDGEILLSEKKIETTAYEKKIYQPTNDFFSKAHNHSTKTPVYYEESVDEYVLYNLAPLHVNHRVVAIIAIQLYMDPIYSAISDTTGLGYTGETILTVYDQEHVKFISPLRTDNNDFLNKKVYVSSEYAIPAIKSLSEKDGFISRVTDYNSIAVDAAWNYLPELQWGIYSKINHKESFKSIFLLRRQLIIIASVLIILSIFFVLFLTRRLLNPIDDIKNNMTKLADGDFPDFIYYKNKDELLDTVTSMNFLVKRLKTSTDLALAIGEGRLHETFEFDKSNDVLSRSLLSMRDNLLLIEDDTAKRKWVTEGITLQSEVIRSTSGDFESLAQTIISTLTEYIGAQHGGLYIQKDDFIESLKSETNKDEFYYELIASYAYTAQNEVLRFKPGQGLVGQCALEKRIIHLDDVDLEFSTITSGLGETSKGSMILVPLVVNQETLGIIELTSYREIKPHVIDFVTKVGENIASSILAAKSSDQTTKLLHQSQAIIKELKTKKKALIDHQNELHLKEHSLMMDNEELRNQIEELKRELRD